MLQFKHDCREGDWQRSYLRILPNDRHSLFLVQVDLFIRSGMVIGLGSGPGSCMAIEYIGQKLKEGTLQDVIGVPT